MASALTAPIFDLGAGPDDQAADDLYDAFSKAEAAFAAVVALLGTKADTASLSLAQLTDVADVIKAVLHVADLPGFRAGIGLGSVANLAPADLPVSTATQTALNQVNTLAASTRALVDTILGGANASVDTFVEVYQRFLADESAATAITNALSAEIIRAKGVEALLATLASPVFTGSPTAPTPAAGDNSKALATTEFVTRAAGASGAVLYNVVQGLAVAARLQAKQNIGVLGGGAPQLTASTVFAASDLNKIYTHYSSGNAAMTHTLPPVSTAIAGDRIAIIAPGLGAGTVYVRPAGSDTLATNGTAYGYANPLFVPQGSAVTFVCDGYNWYSEGYHTPMRSALNAHVAQSFSDTEKQQLLANADLAIPHCQGRLVYDANYQIALRVAVGNKIFINGNYRTIPAGGVAASNSGLSASTLYYVFAYWDASAQAVKLAIGIGAPAVDPLYGHKVVNNQGSDAANRVFTYVGIVYVGSDGKFVDSPAFRGVVTAYNKRLRSIAGAAVSASTSSTSQVELSASARAYVLIEAGTSLIGSAFGNGGTGNSQAGYPMYAAASLDGADGVPGGMSSNAAYGNSSLPSGYAWDPSEGLHYLTVKGSVPSGVSGTFNGAVSGMVMC